MAAKVVLGISLGTRRIGIAVMQENKLIHRQVKTFSGTWSQQKLKSIIETIISTVDRCGIENIRVKIPDTLPSSKAYMQLMGTLNLMATTRHASVAYYTLKDIKFAYAGSHKICKDELIKILVNKHTQLAPEYKKELANKEPYYMKMFEAVLCAQNAFD